MIISAIGPKHNYNKYNQQYSNKVNTTSVKNYPCDSVSFGLAPEAILAGKVANKLTTAGLSILIKDGIASLNSARKKAFVKADLIKRFLNIKKDIANGNNPADIIFALAKYPGQDEPNGLIYEKFDKFKHEISIEKLRDCALREIFPYMHEQANDPDCSRAAKSALLTSMVDTGEFVDSHYFYKVFKELPHCYDELKVVLLQKMLRDKNASDNFYKRADLLCKSDYDRDKYNEKRLFAITALASTLNPQVFPKFFYDFKDSLEYLNNNAMKRIHNILTSDGNFYHCYRGGLKRIGEYSNPYEQALTDNYYFGVMSQLKNDTNAGAEFFKISKEYFEDIKKDYEVLEAIGSMKDETKIEQLMTERVRQKLLSKDVNIKYSVLGFLNYSFRGDKYAHLLPQEMRKNLQEQMEEITPRMWRDSKHQIEYGYNNYRYAGNDTFMDKESLRKILYPPKAEPYSHFDEDNVHLCEWV